MVWPICTNSAFLAIATDRIHSFITQCIHFLIAAYSRTTHHTTQLASSQTCFPNITVRLLYSYGLHTHQISIHESIFGTWWNGRFAAWMSSWKKSALLLWCDCLNMDQNLRGLCPASCWIKTTKISGSFELKSGSNLVLASVPTKVASDLLWLYVSEGKFINRKSKLLQTLESY